MSGTNAERERDLLRRIKAVVECKSERFVDILKAAEIDPRTGLRFRNFSGMSFRGEDLRGFDFTGANLCGCSFDNARISGARFDQARIGQFRNVRSGQSKLPLMHAVDLTKAKDWRRHVRSDWKPADRKTTDDHLPVGAVFQDAHIAPEMIVLPTASAWNDLEIRITRRIAMSRYAINEDNRLILKGSTSWGQQGGLLVSRDKVLHYCDQLRKKTGQPYRLPTTEELRFACASGSLFTNSDWKDPYPSFVTFPRSDDVNYNAIVRPTEIASGLFPTWRSDNDTPIYLSVDLLLGRAVEVRERDGDIKVGDYENEDVGFHVVRDLQYGF